MFSMFGMIVASICFLKRLELESKCFEKQLWTNHNNHLLLSVGNKEEWDLAV